MQNELEESYMWYLETFFFHGLAYISGPWGLLSSHAPIGISLY